jgi:pSer/pThr/pTyr-binding forkhead associated (FHA) protein
LGDKHILSMECRNDIGRHPSMAICIKDCTVARRHCEILWEETNNQFTITDLDSRNGTFVNGTIVEPRQCTPLNTGDEIQCGRTIFQLKKLHTADPNSSACET